jgi:PAS domain S-box-containing protein
VSSKKKEVAEIENRRGTGKKSPARLARSDKTSTISLLHFDREEEQEKLHLQTKLIDSSFEPILAWDFDAGIIEWNPGCERLYGFLRAEVVGRVIHDLLRTVHATPIEEFKKRLAAQGEWVGELRQTAKDGREVIVESRQQITEVGGRRLVLETNRDITESKRLDLNNQFINELDLALSQLINPDEFVQLVTSKVCEYLGVAHCHVSEINRFEGVAVVRESWEGLLEGAQSLAGEYRIDEFTTPEFRERLEAGDTAIVNDVTTDLRTRDFASRYLSFGVGAWISVPALHEKQWEATLTALEPKARNWRLDEAQLLRHITSRLWSAIKRARAVEALRESAERARRTMAEQMVAGVAECNRAGKFTLVNQRFCDIAGYTRAELLEMVVRDVTHPQDWPHNAELYRNLFETGDSFLIEKRYCRKDGSEVWVNMNVSPIRNLQDKIEGAVAVVIDVSRRKHAEQELSTAKERLAADLEAMTRLQKIVATFVREGDLSATLTEIVQAAVAITGADKGNIQLFDPSLGKLVIAAHHNFEQTYLDFWNTVEEGEGACGTALRGGERVIVEDVTLSPIFVGTPALDVQLQAGVRAVQSTPVLNPSGKLVAVFSTHFGAPCRLDERVLRLLDLLAAETASIIERAEAQTALRYAYEQAEAATRAKDEFLAVVSHELRTPLVSILGYTQLLHGKTPDAARIRRTVEVIERNSKTQLQLIEDLLDSARIVGGKLKLEVEPLDLLSVIMNALDVVRPSAEAKGITLDSSLNPLAGQITGDPERLRQVVWNLLSNAIKFTPAGGRVEITLKRDDPHVQIIVRDTGKGIEPELLPHIFDRFRQGDMSSKRRSGGLGLGLALVKHLVELHGGTVEAASAGGGQGATFTIRLPLRAVYTAPLPEREQRQAIRPTEAQSLAGVRVLIVDDEEDVRALLSLTLQGYGAESQAVASGKEALERLSRQTPDATFDVLICDIGMPDEDGYILIRKVRAQPPEAGGTIPAIALTAYGRAPERVRALEAGFQMHVVKPVEPDELVAVILSLGNRFD